MPLATPTNEPAPRKRPFWTMTRREGLAGYLFVAPQVAGTITFVLVPLGLVFWYSLHEWNVLAGTFKFVNDAYGHAEGDKGGRALAKDGEEAGKQHGRDRSGDHCDHEDAGAQSAGDEGVGHRSAASLDEARVNVVEGDKKREQAYEGVVIAKRNRGLNSNFIVRKISSGEGVERTFQTYSPMLASIEVKRRGDVRRAKLYYLRERSGKSARIREKLAHRSQLRDTGKTE